MEINFFRSIANSTKIIFDCNTFSVSIFGLLKLCMITYFVDICHAYDVNETTIIA